MKSQVEMVRKHLDSGRYIDPIIAFKLYGISRLAAVIEKLQSIYYPIQDRKLFKLFNMFGKPVHMMRYRKGWGDFSYFAKEFIRSAA